MFPHCNVLCAALPDSTGLPVYQPKLMRTLLPYTDDTTNNYGQAQNLNVDGLKNPSGLSVDWVAR